MQDFSKGAGGGGADWLVTWSPESMGHPPKMSQFENWTQFKTVSQAY